MKKLLTLIGMICILIVGIVIKSFYGYRLYVPKVFDGDNIVDNPKMLTKEHQNNLIQVLKYYKENWKLEDGEIFVSNRIDDELLWNYTLKANDSVWLIKHK